jgi:hypothetical protein
LLLVGGRAAEREISSDAAVGFAAAVLEGTGMAGVWGKRRGATSSAFIGLGMCTPWRAG